MPIKQLKLLPLKPGWAKRSLREIKIFDDYATGKRDSLPRAYKITNVVTGASPVWIRTFRRSLGLDMHKFGGLIGAQAADVKAWENGISSPNNAELRLLGLLALKPALVRFMRSEWPDDSITKSLKGKR